MVLDKSTSLAKRIARIVESLPSDSVRRIVEREHSEITKFNVSEIAELHGQKSEQMKKIIQELKSNKNPLIAIATALEAKELETNDNEVQIVWTGPITLETGIRNTDSAMKEVIESAKTGETIVIVDYYITKSAGKIIELLKERIDDGVKVLMIIDENENNKTEIRKCFPKNSLQRPEIFTRREKGKFKIHAKIMIGGDMMLMTSANLTELGTQVNFELGMMITGSLTGKMRDIIDEMIDGGHFTPWDL